uniref:Uncharacterized protein n=2 Tax=Aplanochytrium stocchinoi TaxID=215587 RepID=A0A7S3LM93_9STRA
MPVETDGGAIGVGGMLLGVGFGIVIGFGLYHVRFRKQRLRLECSGGLKRSASKPIYVLYAGPRCPYSIKLIVFLAEAGLLEVTQIVHPTQQDLDKISAKMGKKAGVPTLKFNDDSYMNESDHIIDYLAKTHGKNRLKMEVLTMFLSGMYRDYMDMHSKMYDIASKIGTHGKLTSGCAWFKALDKDGDGNVSLEELLDGLNVTRLLAEARRGAIHEDSKWVHAVEQTDELIRDNPNFVEGYRLRLILATISDNYTMLFDAADNILRLKPGDHQSLLLKAVYCKSLGKTAEFEETMKLMEASSATISNATKSLMEQVDGIWEHPIKTSIESGIKEKLSILALGSPADDDGTPRPRLLGTLKKTLEVAKTYPEAEIFVTGGAVSSSMPEAIAMRNWLVKHGISKNRIIMEMKARDTVGNYVEILPMLRERNIKKVVLVTVLYHLQRSSVLAEAVFDEGEGDEIEVIRIGGESDFVGEKLTQRLKVERAASYRDLARALRLYEQRDFKRRCSRFTTAVKKIIHLRSFAQLNK